MTIHERLRHIHYFVIMIWVELVIITLLLLGFTFSCGGNN